MLNVNKCTKTKPKPLTLIFNNSSRVYHCVQLSDTTKHRRGLIIFPLILQTIIIAQMMSTGEEGNVHRRLTGPICARKLLPQIVHVWAGR